LAHGRASRRNHRGAAEISLSAVTAGVNTSDIDVVQTSAILNQLRPLFENGSLDRPRIAERYSLDDFVTAYARVRAAVGKVVFCFG
jgi:NADPH:quinone reductase-like Zn-dependent oxidoreductase